MFAPTSPDGAALPVATHRITSIDLLRGIVMIIMALDHARDYLHTTGMTQDPTNMQTTTVWLFLTRFITHFCAPVFVFLAGTSGWLQARRKSKSELSVFLVTRGLWLIFAEVVLVGFIITFDPGYHLLFLQTIWAIGISMVFLGIAVHLPFWAVLAMGTAIVLGHNALDFYEQGKQQFPAWYHFVHRPGPLTVGDGRAIFVAYPFLSWTGLMFLGYCFGRLYTHCTEQARKKWLLLLGIGLLVLFVALRASNLYGDRQHWTEQKNTLFTALSFINVVKYPPSLLYMCITIGPALLFLAAAGEHRGRFGRIISVYGSVPFFYYMLHFFLLHLVTMVFYFAHGHSFAEGMQGYKNAFNFVQPGEGLRLTWVYVIWISVVVALYWPCRWFSNYKKTHRQWWLSYL
ncbi:MAG: DUF1624 domain-containing protein [Chitinophagaceae bacterium]|nr:MAG: DUF1624 domain-containing protein [Chitinophagaceae bacterium]